MTNILLEKKGLYAVATINAINLFDANTHALVSTFASSPTREAIRFISFFDHSSLLLVITPHSLYTMDLLSKQVLWLLLVDVTKVAVNASGLTDRPLFAVTLHNTPETDSILILSPESSTPVASVTLNAHVEAMCWGKESIRGRRGEEGDGVRRGVRRGQGGGDGGDDEADEELQ